MARLTWLLPWYSAPRNRNALWLHSCDRSVL